MFYSLVLCVTLVFYWPEMLIPTLVLVHPKEDILAKLKPRLDFLCRLAWPSFAESNQIPSPGYCEWVDFETDFFFVCVILISLPSPRSTS